jgi:hypothetical protein
VKDLDTISTNARCVARGDDGGAWHVVFRGENLMVVVSHGMGWDHVSVSHQRRTPNWYELEHVKRMFFKDDEVAMQLHMPVADHISVHPHCLHLWRPQNVEIPLPLPEMVA